MQGNTETKKHIEREGNSDTYEKEREGNTVTQLVKEQRERQGIIETSEYIEKKGG